MEPRLARRREEHKSPVTNRLPFKDALKKDCRDRARAARMATAGGWRAGRIAAQLSEMTEFVRAVAAGTLAERDSEEKDDEACSGDVDTGYSWADVTEEGKTLRRFRAQSVWSRLRAVPLLLDIEEIAQAILQDMHTEMEEYERSREEAWLQELCDGVDGLADAVARADDAAGSDATAVLCPVCKKRWLACDGTHARCQCGFSIAIEVGEVCGMVSRCVRWNTVRMLHGVQVHDGLERLQQRLCAAFESHMELCHHDPRFCCDASGRLCLSCDGCQIAALV